MADMPDIPVDFAREPSIAAQVNRAGHNRRLPCQPDWRGFGWWDAIMLPTGEHPMSDKTQPKKKRVRKGGAFPGVGLQPKAQAQAASPSHWAGKPESKTERVIALLRHENGATLDELVTTTGWQPHTTRAALTGLKKKGLVIASEKTDGVRRYRAEEAQ
jgi:hypothetical protein